jgi:hypothetical protein
MPCEVGEAECDGIVPELAPCGPLAGAGAHVSAAPATTARQDALLIDMMMVPMQ